jgi:hypothetical protein
MREHPTNCRLALLLTQPCNALYRRFGGRQSQRQQEAADRDELLQQAELGRQMKNEMDEEQAVMGHIGRSRRYLNDMFEQGGSILVGMAGNRERIKVRVAGRQVFVKHSASLCRLQQQKEWVPPLRLYVNSCNCRAGIKCPLVWGTCTWGCRSWVRSPLSRTCDCFPAVKLICRKPKRRCLM